MKKLRVVAYSDWATKWCLWPQIPGSESLHSLLWSLWIIGLTRFSSWSWPLGSLVIRVCKCGLQSWSDCYISLIYFFYFLNFLLKSPSHILYIQIGCHMAFQKKALYAPPQLRMASSASQTSAACSAFITTVTWALCRLPWGPHLVSLLPPNSFELK